ncbi:MAG: ABC-F family ATP-binding cassette domain-containing protein [Saprospiraceae bacterium]|nr:ABC-F family ATP-binding cassette domain-containing protein [Saprospiraceae bacterium]
MYSVQNIDLYFGDLHLLQDVSFVISPGEKIALLGRNGAGKTTLFKIINNELTPDNGNISFPKTTKLAYLSQHFDFDDTKTIHEVCLEAFEAYYAIEAEIETKNKLLAQTQDEQKLSDIINELEDLQMKMNAFTIHNPLAEIGKILKGLGFTEDQFNNQVNTLSGGWKMRVQMAKILLSQPDLLLLDEPDNHLDIEALIWFEKYLQKYEGAVIFISHDVQFISNIANRILELANRKIFDFKGSYQKYISAKEVRREKDEQAFVNQQKVIKSKERTITRFMAKASKTKMAQSMQKQLEKLDRIELETDDINQMRIQFPTVHNPGKIVVKVDAVSKSYGDKEVLEDVSLEIERGQKVAFVGQNGQGKSTLVKIIAGLLDYNTGNSELGHNVIPNYFAQNQSEVFDDKLTALETLESRCDPEFYTRARHTLGAFAFSGEDALKKVSVLSGGEKSRLAMACLVSKKSNFLILDEPTNHLDIQAKAILKQAIMDYPGTLIIVSHDRDILSGSVDVTYEFRDKKIYQHLGDLDYVLEKRAQEDIRAFELSNNKKINSDKSKPPIDYHAQKQMKRKISAIERAIDKLEKEIKTIHEKLVDPEFYNSPESADAIKKLKELEDQLEVKMGEWDACVGEMGG